MQSLLSCLCASKLGFALCIKIPDFVPYIYKVIEQLYSDPLIQSQVETSTFPPGRSLPYRF